jgi:hypothetical protein
MKEVMYKEIIYKDEWVLIDAYFYKFWMHIIEFKKFNI